MRFVGLVILFLSVPILVSLLRQMPHRRDWALTGIGFVLLLGGGQIASEVALYSWPLWNGIAKGAAMSLVDALAVALIATRRPRREWLPFWPVLLIYFTMLVLSMFQSSVPMASFFACWQFARVLLLFSAIGGETDRPGAVSGLLRGFALGLVVQAVVVVDQKLQGVVQATGLLVHQNTLGMLVELAVVPLIGSVMAGARGKLLFLGILAGLVVIAGGGSRGAMGLAAGGMVVLMLLSLIAETNPAKLRIVGLGAMALLIVVPFGLLTLKDRFGTHSVITQEQERDAFEVAARSMASDHPFGVGANMYVPTANTGGYSQRAGVAWNTGNRSAPVHNVYLLARAETGWHGEYAFIAMLVWPALAGLRLGMSRRRLGGRDMVLASAVALGVNALHNNFEFAGLTSSVLLMIGANLGIVAAGVRASRRASGGRSAPRRASAPPVAAAPGWATAQQQPH